MKNSNVTHQQDFYNPDKSSEILQDLLNLTFEPHSISVYGHNYKHICKTTAFVDPDIFYALSGTNRTNIRYHPWTSWLLDIKSDIEKAVNHEYNCVIICMYENGSTEINQYHESEYSKNLEVPITTLTFGSTRIHEYYKKKSNPVQYIMESGSLLSLYKSSKHEWTHTILPNYVTDEPHIILTFQKISTASLKPPLKRMCKSKIYELAKFHIGLNVFDTVDLLQDELCYFERN